jgi:hypothetical protein
METGKRRKRKKAIGIDIIGRHGSILVGFIKKAAPDGLWMTGEVELTPAANAYKEAFEFMTDDEKRSAKPPFDEAVFDNRSREDENGQRRETMFPAVHDDGEISWRW